MDNTATTATNSTNVATGNTAATNTTLVTTIENGTPVTTVVQVNAPDASNVKPVRKPGRPPKKKLTDIQVQTFGIDDGPKVPGHIMEVVYENPTLFKKLFALYKKYGISEVTWDFYPDKIEHVARDFEKKCVIKTEIYGEMLVRYYCKEPMSRTVKRDNLDKVFKSMDKNYPQVSIVLRDEDSRSKIYIVVANNEVDAVFTYDPDLIKEPEQQNIQVASDVGYPVKFELPSKHFKKLISDIHASGSDIFTLKKEGLEPVSFTYEAAKKLNLAATYKNSEKIGLKCTLDPDDIFSVSVPIKHIRPFSDSNIGDTVHIAADKNGDFSIWSYVDKKKIPQANNQIKEAYVCKVQVFASIIKA